MDKRTVILGSIILTNLVIFLFGLTTLLIYRNNLTKLLYPILIPIQITSIIITILWYITSKNDDKLVRSNYNNKSSNLQEITQFIQDHSNFEFLYSESRGFGMSERRTFAIKENQELTHFAVPCRTDISSIEKLYPKTNKNIEMYNLDHPSYFELLILPLIFFLGMLILGSWLVGLIISIIWAIYQIIYFSTKNFKLVIKSDESYFVISFFLGERIEKFLVAKNSLLKQIKKENKILKIILDENNVIEFNYLSKDFVLPNFLKTEDSSAP